MHSIGYVAFLRNILATEQVTEQEKTIFKERLICTVVDGNDKKEETGESVRTNRLNLFFYSFKNYRT